MTVYSTPGERRPLLTVSLFSTRTRTRFYLGSSGACPFIPSLLFSSLRVRHRSPPSPTLSTITPLSTPSVHASPPALLRPLLLLLPCPGRRLLSHNTSHSYTGHFLTAYRPIIGTDFMAKMLPHHSMPDPQLRR
jgi:hypothetical protein